MKSSTLATSSSLDRVVWRTDLQTELNVTSNTVLRWMKAGKLPPPDVAISRKTKGWRLSTLHNAGIGIALANPGVQVEPGGLSQALEKLLSTCQSSDDAGYGALSTSFVRGIVHAALARGTDREEYV